MEPAIPLTRTSETTYIVTARSYPSETINLSTPNLRLGRLFIVLQPTTHPQDKKSCNLAINEETS